MNIYYPRIILILLMISILLHKTNAHENIIINPEICQIALLSHEKALSTFFEAIGKNDRDKLLTFKDMNWDLQTSYQNGQILLHYAALLGRVEIVHTLVSEIRIDVNVQDPANGLTALHYAALYTDPLSRIDTIYILIKLGADINILDNSDHSASDYVEDKRIPHFRYSKEQKIKATELTALPYNIDMSTLAKLLQVVDSTLNRWVRQHKTEHNIPTKNQQLFQDIKTRPVKALKNGVTQKQTAKQPDISEPAASDRINQYKVDAKTHQILLLNHKKTLPIFFEAIDQNDRDKRLTFKDMNWDLQTNYQNGQILLHYAAMLGRVEIIHTLVSEIGIDVNVQYPANGLTALHYAALYTDISSRIDTIHALITLGAKVHVLDNVGYRASYYLEDKEKPLYFKYSIEQKVKAAKLTLPPYNIRITELARILQMNHTTLSNWANQYRDKYNIQTNKPNLQELRAKAIKMLKNGFKKSQIAKELGVPKSTVSSWTRQQNKEYNKKVKTSKPHSQKKKRVAIHLVLKVGITQKQAAKKLGVPTSSVSDWISQHTKERNIQTEQPDFQELKTRAIKMLKANKTQKQIAKELGISNYTLSNWLRPYKEKHNIIKKRQTHSQEVKDKAIDLFIKSDMSEKEIAEELEVATRTISNWLRPYKERHNIRTKRQPYPQEVKDKAIEMFKSGISTVKIAEELEVATRTISDWLLPYKEENNIPIQRPHLQEVKNKAIDIFIKSDMSEKEIAEELEVATQTISNWLRPYKEKHNIPRQKRRNYSKEQRSTVIKMFFEDHKTNVQISKDLKIPAGTISLWVNKHKIKNGLETKKIRTYYSSEFKEEAIEMVTKDKMSVKEVAKALNIPKDNLYHWVHQHKKQQEEIETNSQKKSNY